MHRSRWNVWLCRRNLKCVPYMAIPDKEKLRLHETVRRFLQNHPDKPKQSQWMLKIAEIKTLLKCPAGRDKRENCSAWRWSHTYTQNENTKFLDVYQIKVNNSNDWEFHRHRRSKCDKITQAKANLEGKSKWWQQNSLCQPLWKMTWHFTACLLHASEIKGSSSRTWAFSWVYHIVYIFHCFHPNSIHVKWKLLFSNVRKNTFFICFLIFVVMSHV